MRTEFGMDEDSPPWPDTERLLIVDDVALACSEVWGGADQRDASALLDHLEDRGLKVERT